ncbi:LysR family transcriptional regulator [Caballeronia novacaledonica]|uniref:LysR family transcriptional regulator n=1 Tax=Caballeronia novacaledonica TaxID=1544861 RepID=A0A2U3IDI2_9BURK|nr:LysR family transcriptional regulator [Caballeronia novacaledonica]SPB18182.1 LysR family transcriptional regulator [Caballeronia novacaledonica]
MDVITHVRTFVAVVKFGTFADAARTLEVVPSVVARRIAALEGELKTRLFERSTRSVALTEAGEKLYARAGDLVSEFDELLTSVERDVGKLEGHLRVMAPTTLATQELAPVFCAFLARHPRITMQLALVDRSANPAESGFDIAISGRLASYDGVVDIPLQPVGSVLCASHDYLSANKLLTHPRDLVTHSCLVFAPIGTTWNFQSSRGVVSVDVSPRLQADDNLTLLRAAVSGLGIALLPKYISAPSLEAGSLVRVLSDFDPQETWFKAYVPRRRMNVARVSALLEWLAKEWKPPRA